MLLYRCSKCWWNGNEDGTQQARLKIVNNNTPAPGITVTHSNGSTTVNEAGYGQGFYDWSELTSPNGHNAAVTRDPAGNLYVAGWQSGNTPSIAKYNSSALNNGLVQ